MSYNAKAIGSGSEGAQTELQDNWHKVSHDADTPHDSNHQCTNNCLLFPSVHQVAGGRGTFAQGAEVGDGGEAQQVKCTVSVSHYERQIQNL